MCLSPSNTRQSRKLSNNPVRGPPYGGAVGEVGTPTNKHQHQHIYPCPLPSPHLRRWPRRADATHRRGQGRFGMESKSSALVEWAAEYTKEAQLDARPPNEWAARVAAAAAAAGEREDVQFSVGLAEMLARVLLSGGGSGAAPATAWKYAEAALAARLASPALLLALLSSRVIPQRVARPTVYRLYLELLRRHGFKLCFQMKAGNFKK
uniref:Uncharacterized protein n=1 Tax=Avena sativa TaxID=4498 RepID=A0ACD6AK03_AVESA